MFLFPLRNNNYIFPFHNKTNILIALDYFLIPIQQDCSTQSNNYSFFEHNVGHNYSLNIKNKSIICLGISFHHSTMIYFSSETFLNYFPNIICDSFMLNDNNTTIVLHIFKYDDKQKTYWLKKKYFEIFEEQDNITFKSNSNYYKCNNSLNTIDVRLNVFLKNK